METNKDTVDILVRAFFNQYFNRIAGSLTGDICSVQPITIKQLLVQNIEDISKDFNSRIVRSFAYINNVEIPQKFANPKTFEGATALIKLSLKGNARMYEYMVERYKYHFTLALSGTVEKADNISDTEIIKAIELMK